MALLTRDNLLKHLQESDIVMAPPSNTLTFSPYKTVLCIKYLGNTLDARGNITSHLMALKERFDILTSKLKKMKNNALDTST